MSDAAFHLYYNFVDVCGFAVSQQSMRRDRDGGNPDSRDYETTAPAITTTAPAAAAWDEETE